MEERDDLVLVFVPALVAVLAFEESKLGRDLTKDEVEAIRNKAACMAVPIDAAIKLDQSRGYDDIRPENVWEDWLEYKASTK